MRTRSKSYKQIVKNAMNASALPIEKAIGQVKALSYSKFVGSLELHINLSKRDKKEGPVKGSVLFPNSIGKETKIIVFSNDPKKIESVQKLKVEDVGNDKLIKKIQGGWTDFDIAIAEPAMMPKITVLGKILGPKGAMPNPRNNTVTDDLETAVKQYQSGKVNFKPDKDNIIHMVVGKLDMDNNALIENVKEALKSVSQATGKNIMSSINSVYLAPTMGPSVKIDKSSL